MSLLHFTAPDGARLAYRDDFVGTGGPVILCLAGLTRNSTDFDYMLPHLPSARVIRPDYRGRGGSAWTGADSYTIPQEARDVLALMDHLAIASAGIIGTSRGGLIGMMIAATARDRINGLCLNDVGPVLARGGLERIFDCVGQHPKAKSHAELAKILPEAMPGFANVPAARWLDEARRHSVETPKGLRINYDPELRTAFLAAFDGPEVDLWPLYEATTGLPLALIRGANSDLLSADTADEMARRHPGTIRAEVPDRAHIPFLDEAESLTAITAWMKLIA